MRMQEGALQFWQKGCWQSRRGTAIKPGAGGWDESGGRVTRVVSEG
jgi:hypothetical protein